MLGDVVFEGSCLRHEILTLSFLLLACVADLGHFVAVLGILLPQATQFLLQVLVVGAQLRVQVVVLGSVALNSRYFGLPRIQYVFLGVQFREQVRILLLPIDELRLLVVNILAHAMYQIYIMVHPQLIIILHLPFFVRDPVEALFEGE